MRTTVDKFFCCELRNGAIFIGIFGTLLSFLLCVECMRYPRVFFSTDSNEFNVENGKIYLMFYNIDY